MKPTSGFTLIELMVTLVVVATILLVGVPNFQEFIKSNRLTAQSNGFVSDLHLARSEAIKRSARVTMCKSTNLTDCTTLGGWEQGWIVFSDQETVGSRDMNDQIIRSSGGVPRGVTIRGNNPVKDRISFLSSGIDKNSYGSLILCDDRIINFSTDSYKARAVVISSTGRIRNVKGGESSLTSCTPS